MQTAIWRSFRQNTRLFSVMPKRSRLYCEKHGISFIPYFPLASGLLTGKFTKDTVFEDFRKDKPQFQGETFIHNLKK